MQKLELTKVYDAEIERSEGNPASKLNTRDSFYAIRSAREEIKSTNKIVEYYNRIIREGKI